MMEQFLRDRRIGVSVSNSSNLAELGLIAEHVEDDLVEVTRYLVAAGATVVYGGDLRQGGFTGLLLRGRSTSSSPRGCVGKVRELSRLARPCSHAA